MKQLLSIALYSTVAILTSPLLQAASQPLDTYWECQATDAKKQIWFGRQPIRQDAINQAAFACRNNSRASDSCISARETCQHIVNGKILRPAWRCTAFDRQTYYQSEPQFTREDTVANALEKCRKNSFAPNNCRVELLTCKAI